MKILHSDMGVEIANAPKSATLVGYYVYGYADAPEAPPVTVAVEHPLNQGEGVEVKGGLLGNVTLLAVNSGYGWREQMNAEETTCYLFKPGRNGEPDRAFIQPLETFEPTPGDKTARPFGPPVELPVERIEKVIGRENLQKIRQDIEQARTQEQIIER